MDYWERLFNVLVFYLLFNLMAALTFIKNGVSWLHIFDHSIRIVPTLCMGYLYILGEALAWMKENRGMMVNLDIITEHSCNNNHSDN